MIFDFELRDQENHCYRYSLMIIKQLMKSNLPSKLSTGIFQSSELVNSYQLVWDQIFAFPFPTDKALQLISKVTFYWVK